MRPAAVTGTSTQQAGKSAATAQAGTANARPAGGPATGATTTTRP